LGLPLQASESSDYFHSEHIGGGPITAHYEASALGDEDQVLYVYSVEPGTRSADAMALLGSSAATLAGAAPDRPNRQRAHPGRVDPGRHICR
jgi:hypothetical protein